MSPIHLLCIHQTIYKLKADTRHSLVRIHEERGSGHTPGVAIINVSQRRLWSCQEHDQAAAHQALHLSVMTRHGSGRLALGKDHEAALDNTGCNKSLRTQDSLPDVWSGATDRSAWRALRPLDGQAILTEYFTSVVLFLLCLVSAA